MWFSCFVCVIGFTLFEQRTNNTKKEIQSLYVGGNPARSGKARPLAGQRATASPHTKNTRSCVRVVACQVMSLPITCYCLFVVCHEINNYVVMFVYQLHIIMCL